MIIPIKCFTCGMVLANKYSYYCREVIRRKRTLKKSLDGVTYLTSEYNGEKTIEGQVLDDMELDKICCRRHMLSHVDIE
jgi:DNA-directed RNA polymerase subunit N (RpoN/RPB10)